MSNRYLLALFAFILLVNASNVREFTVETDHQLAIEAGDSFGQPSDTSLDIHDPALPGDAWDLETRISNRVYCTHRGLYSYSHDEIGHYPIRAPPVNSLT